MPWEWEDVPAFIERLGPEEVGRLCTILMQQSLRSIGAGEPKRAENPDDPLGWVTQAVLLGDDVEPDVHFRMVMAAITAAADDETTQPSTGCSA